MKISPLVLLMFFSLNGQVIHAADSVNTPDKEIKSTAKSSTGMFKQVTPELLYSYVDFNFNSTNGRNFNRYQGHSNIYSVGVDHIIGSPDLVAGLYFFKVDTGVNSQVLLNPGTVTTTAQTIRNTTVFGHFRKSFNPNFDVDLAGGYGINQISTQTLILANTPLQALGVAKNNNLNWFSSLNLMYKKPWKKLDIRAYVGILYSQIHAGSYSLWFPLIPEQKVNALTNNVTYVIEGAELNYKINPVLSPFINASLIQVAQFSLSRATLLTPINGSLPQLNMDQNGYKLGAGISVNLKKFTLRLEEKYYSAGAFSSNQAIAGLEYRFS